MLTVVLFGVVLQSLTKNSSEFLLAIGFLLPATGQSFSLFEHWRHQSHIATALTPYVTSLWALCLAIFVQGLLQGLSDLGSISPFVDIRYGTDFFFVHSPCAISDQHIDHQHVGWSLHSALESRLFRLRSRRSPLLDYRAIISSWPLSQWSTRSPIEFSRTLHDRIAVLFNLLDRIYFHCFEAETRATSRKTVPSEIRRENWPEFGLGINAFVESETILAAV